MPISSVTWSKRCHLSSGRIIKRRTWSTSSRSSSPRFSYSIISLLETSLIVPRCRLVQPPGHCFVVKTPFLLLKRVFLDFPQEQLMVHDFTKFKALKPNLMAMLDELLSSDISKLMPLLRQEEIEAGVQAGVQGGAFLGTRAGPFMEGDPFGETMAENGEVGEEDEEWVVTKDKSKYDEIFYNLAPNEGKLSGTKAKDWMVSTRLPTLCWAASGSSRMWIAMACWMTKSLPWPATWLKWNWTVTGCPLSCLPVLYLHPSADKKALMLRQFAHVVSTDLSPHFLHVVQLYSSCSASPFTVFLCHFVLWSFCNTQLMSYFVFLVQMQQFKDSQLEAKERCDKPKTGLIWKECCICRHSFPDGKIIWHHIQKCYTRLSS